ncbi:hypothetical protein FUT79_09205 [Treponema phagedenis]|uniref:hypothetical protein n=1 Tax=Treponema phagedenis TaxID=162 RepID=UPI0011E62008|nr:hypothetical protein [Treponema phagedenis]QEJ95362.1 hypothetical protein FUT79_09205 [Treponema phagedenis]
MKMDLTKKINDLIKAKDASGLMALIKEHGGYIFRAELTTVTTEKAVNCDYLYTTSFEEAISKAEEYRCYSFAQKEIRHYIGLDVLYAIDTDGENYGYVLYSETQECDRKNNLNDSSFFERVKEVFETLPEDKLKRFKKCIKASLM